METYVVKKSNGCRFFGLKGHTRKVTQGGYGKCVKVNALGMKLTKRTWESFNHVNILDDRIVNAVDTIIPGDTTALQIFGCYEGFMKFYKANILLKHLDPKEADDCFLEKKLLMIGP